MTGKFFLDAYDKITVSIKTKGEKPIMSWCFHTWLKSYSKMCRMWTIQSQVVPPVATMPFKTAGSQYKTTARVLTATVHVVISRYSCVLVYQCITVLNGHRHAHEYMYENIYMHTKLSDLIRLFVILKEMQDMKNIDIKDKKIHCMSHSSTPPIPSTQTRMHACTHTH
jgi:hypothetical protein